MGAISEAGADEIVDLPADNGFNLRFEFAQAGGGVLDELREGQLGRVRP